MTINTNSAVDFRIFTAKKEETPKICCPQDKLVIIIPAFNEERFIGSVVLKSLQYSHNVIVIDDGSTDDTAEIAANAGATVLQHLTNKGKAAALNTAIRMVRDFAPGIVVMIDADGQHLPEELPLVIDPILNSEADIVVGSRYIKNTSNTPLHRRIGHFLINIMTGVCSGIFVTDSQSGYRAFSQKAIQCSLFHSNGFTVESEMQFLAKQYGLRVKEVPVTIRYTDKAKRSVISQGLMVLNGIIKLTGQYRPLLFFGGSGAIVSVLGFLGALFVLARFNQTHELATGYAILSMMLVVVGMVLFTSGIIMHSIQSLLIDMLKKN